MTTNGDYTDAEKQYLLSLARATLVSYLHDRTMPEIDTESLPDSLRRKSGCFVTLHTVPHQLRGCIGTIMPEQKLYKAVMQRAIDAALNDPRFPPVSESELSRIQLEISILTPPEELSFTTTRELLDQLTPMRDGVVLRTPYGSSTFLPQVWEQLTDKAEFLGHLCTKHGAPYDTWRKPEILTVSTYQAIVFSEHAYGLKAAGPRGAVAGPGGATTVGSAHWGTEVTEPQPVAPGEKIEPLSILSPDSDIIQQ